MDLPENVVAELNCSQCREYLSVFPISSYENGEFVCGRCPLIDDQNPSRDHSYEAVARHIKFPCIYKPHGCNELLAPAEMKPHEPDCYYRQWFCPAVSTTCNWQGLLEALPEHYALDHTDFLKKKGKFEVSDGVENWEENYLLQDQGEVFLIKLKKLDSDGIYGTVSLIGFNFTGHSYEYKINWALAGSDEGGEEVSGKVEKYRGNHRLGANEGKLIKTSVANATVFELEVKLTRENSSFKPEEKLGDLNMHILKMIECPLCFEYMSSPIYQCPNSHTVCSECKKKTNICGFCQVQIGDLRNRQLEEISEKCHYTCRFNGCSATYSFAEKTGHEARCEFAPYECPFDNCAFASMFKMMHDHLSNVHSEDFCETNTLNVYFTEDYTHFKILKRGHCLFFIKNVVVNKILNIGVKFFGPKELNKGFNFIFDLRNVDTQERVFFKKRCTDIGEEDNCLTVSVDMLKKFKVGICATFYIYIEDKISK